MIGIGQSTGVRNRNSKRHRTERQAGLAVRYRFGDGSQGITGIGFEYDSEVTC